MSIFTRHGAMADTGINSNDRRPGPGLGSSGLREEPSPSGGAPRSQSPRRWSSWSAAPLLSVTCSVIAISAAGALSAVLCPIVTELQAERVRAEDGTEVRILGFWSILVLSLFAGWICWSFSWTLIYLDSNTPGSVFPKPQFHSRRTPEPSFHLGYAVAVLNGIMATLVVVWSLS